jgi:hypothetical protein
LPNDAQVPAWHRPRQVNTSEARRGGGAQPLHARHEILNLPHHQGVERDVPRIIRTELHESRQIEPLAVGNAPNMHVANHFVVLGQPALLLVETVPRLETVIAGIGESFGCAQHQDRELVVIGIE